MKPKNFPGRKLERKLVAEHGRFWMVDKPELMQLINNAQAIRTKKIRSSARLS